MNAPPRKRPMAPQIGRFYDSCRVHPDRSITFRLDAPNARRVELVSDITSDVLSLARGEDGLWSVTTPPLAPALYGYAFSVDGVDQPDPRNPRLKPNLISHASLVLVSDSPPRPWEPQAIPHGTLSTHLYTTSAVEGLPANQSRYVVYTPPGYCAPGSLNPSHAPRLNTPLPVLYLLHGWSDAETSWTEVGQAHLMLDAMIASGSMQPLIVVMPLGYGQMSFVRNGFKAWQNPSAILENALRFRQALMSEILPRVEEAYDTRRDREGRAIAGLSMGGLQALLTGLNHPGQFSRIGGFSSALSVLNALPADTLFPGVSAAHPKPDFLWLTCGIADPLLEANRAAIAWLVEQGLKVISEETEGGHTWPVWRNALLEFLLKGFK